MIKNFIKKAAVNTVSGDWFYMNEKELTVRDIKNALDLYPEKLELEIWEAAGVLEIALSEKTSFDFETLKPYFKDKEGDEFLKQNHIQTLLMATFQPQDLKCATSLMKHIVSHCGGFFCEDTPDFSNRI